MYSHTPRRVFEKAIDRLSQKLARYAQENNRMLLVLLDLQTRVGLMEVYLFPIEEGPVEDPLLKKEILENPLTPGERRQREGA